MKLQPTQKSTRPFTQEPTSVSGAGSKNEGNAKVEKVPYCSILSPAHPELKLLCEQVFTGSKNVNKFCFPQFNFNSLSKDFIKCNSIRTEIF